MPHARNSRPELVMDDEGDDEKQTFICLFCSHTTHDLPSLWRHTATQHRFDFPALSSSLLLDFYSRIRLINFVRHAVKEGFSEEDIRAEVQGRSWLEGDRFLQPVLEDDAVLMSLEDEDDWDDDEDGGDEKGEQQEEEEEDDEDEDGNDEPAESTRERMLREAREGRARQEKRMQDKQQPESAAGAASSSSASAPSPALLQQLRQENARLQEENAQLQAALASMRITLTDLMTSAPSQPSTTPPPLLDSSHPTSSLTTNGHAPSHTSQSSSSTSSSTSPSPVRTPTTPSTLSTTTTRPSLSTEDDGYFGGYSTRRIHELMLRDKARTLAYQRFMYANPHLFQGKVVLDVGCGTGILALFAAKAGARLVVGVDAADIADEARAIVKANGYEGKVVIVKGKMEEVQLPVERVDVIISEWMGYFLLYESMLPSVLYARDRYLSPLPPTSTSSSSSSDSPSTLPPRVYPNLATMHIAGMHDRRHRSERVEYWRDVYGFDFSTLIHDTDRYWGSSVEVVHAEDVVTDGVVLRRIDVGSVVAEELEFTEKVTLVMKRDEVVEALVVWFDTTFDGGVGVEGGGKEGGGERVVLSTAPSEVATHWMQTVFRLHEKVEGKKGEQVQVELTAKRMEKLSRSYRVHIAYGKLSDEHTTQHRFVQEYTIE